MTQRPDLNRRTPGDNDPELDARHEKHDDGIGNISSSRLGMPSWATAVVILLILAFLVVVLLRSSWSSAG
ncbi:MAG TPA: hypothetical protein VFH27_09045 [Longimicrobiaceae bacterium]|nr:hypothetical protein [Longimicrobiaceae bacterium]